MARARQARRQHQLRDTGRAPRARGPSCFRTRTVRLLETHSIAAGLDYPGVGPEHSFLAASKGRVTPWSMTRQALAAFKLLNRLEGIAPALESAHAIGYLEEYCKDNQGRKVLVNLSGRGRQGHPHGVRRADHD